VTGLARHAGTPDDLPPDLLQQAAGTFGLLASKHLAKLKLAGLVRSRREGRYQVYLLDDPRLVQIVGEMVGRLREQQPGTGRTRDVGA
jgi:hypothetical protein